MVLGTVRFIEKFLKIIITKSIRYDEGSIEISSICGWYCSSGL